jgi:diguanylate cyclase (GGDEF)-like protein
VLYLDLDGFKPINDRLGHAVGDTVLRHVATRLRSVVRESDSLGRLGGDEFIVICTDTDHAAAAAIAERIHGAIAEPMDGIPDSMAISVSIGVAVHRHSRNSDLTTDEILDVADTAMYRAKKSGRNGTHVMDC